MSLRPMLASPADEAELRVLRFPKLISAKIDGVRAICLPGPVGPTLYSRNLKPIPNLHCQELFAKEEFLYMDGELAVGNPWDKNLMQQTTSGVMSVAGEPEVTWHVFDRFHESAIYALRAHGARHVIGLHRLRPNAPGIQWVAQQAVYSYEEMMREEEKLVALGFEGAMIRCPASPYKQGRSTVKQEWLLKIKRFADDEAVIIGTVEQNKNTNEATLSELGYTKRSTHKAGKVASGVLGALMARGITGQFKGVEFEVGTGFSTEQRANLWENKDLLVGQVFSFKHFPIGVLDKPRFPTFKSFRNRRDM